MQAVTDGSGNDAQLNTLVDASSILSSQLASNFHGASSNGLSKVQNISQYDLMEAASADVMKATGVIEEFVAPPEFTKVYFSPQTFSINLICSCSLLIIFVYII